MVRSSERDHRILCKPPIPANQLFTAEGYEHYTAFYLAALRSEDSGHLSSPAVPDACHPRREESGPQGLLQAIQGTKAQMIVCAPMMSTQRRVAVHFPKHANYVSALAIDLDTSVLNSTVTL